MDGLRGIAILLVMLHHLIRPEGLGIFGRYCEMGWTGVDLFLVLSGFLIAGILFDAQNERDYLRNFYIRRVLRLFPAYAVFVCVVLLLVCGTGEHPSRITLPYLCYGANIVYIFEPNFTRIGPPTVVHPWSLALEEQFYLIWPWLVAWLASRERILKACVAGIIGSLCLRLALAHAPLPPGTVYRELPTRADSLLMGAAIAMIVRDPRFDLRRIIWSVRAMGVIAAIAFWWIGRRVGHEYLYLPVSTWGFSFVAIVAGAALLLSLDEKTWTNRVCATRVLRLFGKYSYGMYLIHFAPKKQYWHFEEWLQGRIPEIWLANLLAFLAMLAAVTATAVLSFHLIEKPFLRMKKLFEYRDSPWKEKPDSAELVAETTGPEGVARKPASGARHGVHFECSAV